MSSIAVFLVLGGATAIAAKQLGKKTVGAKQLKANAVTTVKIKNNAVSTKKLKNNAVTTGKVKNGAITGAKVELSTLGTVPSATTAANASNLAGFSRKFIRANASPEGASQEASQAASPELVMFTQGPLTVYAKCFDWSGTTYGMLFIRTTENGVAFDSDYDELYGDPFLDVGTPESDRELLENSASGDSASIYGGHTPSLSAFAPNGTALKGSLEIATKNGNLSEGNGVYGAGSVCLFAGEVTNVNG
jgi:hypothetical protein